MEKIDKFNTLKDKAEKMLISIVYALMCVTLIFSFNRINQSAQLQHQATQETIKELEANIRAVTEMNQRLEATVAKQTEEINSQLQVIKKVESMFVGTGINFQ